MRSLVPAGGTAPPASSKTISPPCERTAWSSRSGTTAPASTIAVACAANLAGAPAVAGAVRDDDDRAGFEPRRVLERTHGVRHRRRRRGHERVVRRGRTPQERRDRRYRAQRGQQRAQPLVAGGGGGDHDERGGRGGRGRHCWLEPPPYGAIRAWEKLLAQCRRERSCRRRSAGGRETLLRIVRTLPHDLDASVFVAVPFGRRTRQPRRRARLGPRTDPRAGETRRCSPRRERHPATPGARVTSREDRRDGTPG